MSQFLKSLEAEIAALEGELEAHPIYQRLLAAKALRDNYASGAAVSKSAARPAPAKSAKPTAAKAKPGRGNAKPVKKRAPRNTGSKALAAVREVLAAADGPVSLAALHEGIEARGATLGGAKPRNTLSAMLSKDAGFKSHGRAGWTLNVAEAADAADAAPASA